MGYVRTWKKKGKWMVRTPCVKCTTYAMPLTKAESKTAEDSLKRVRLYEDSCASCKRNLVLWLAIKN